MLTCKNFTNKVELSSQSNFVQEQQNIYGQRDNKKKVLEEINNTLGKKTLTKKNFVNYINKVHINKLKKVVPDKL